MSQQRVYVMDWLSLSKLTLSLFVVMTRRVSLYPYKLVALGDLFSPKEFQKRVRLGTMLAKQVPLLNLWFEVFETLLEES